MRVGSAAWVARRRSSCLYIFLYVYIDFFQQQQLMRFFWCHRSTTCQWGCCAHSQPALTLLAHAIKRSKTYLGLTCFARLDNLCNKNSDLDVPFSREQFALIVRCAAIDMTSRSRSPRRATQLAIPAFRRGSWILERAGHWRTFMHAETTNHRCLNFLVMFSCCLVASERESI